MLDIYVGLSAERMRVSPAPECINTAALLLLLYCCFISAERMRVSPVRECLHTAALRHTCTHRRHSSLGTFSGTGARQSVRQSVSIVIRTFVPVKQVSMCTFVPVKQVNCAPGGSARRMRSQQTESDCLSLGAASTASARYTGAASITPAAAATASAFAPYYQ
jgi:hypothetical protein